MSELRKRRLELVKALLVSIAVIAATVWAWQRATFDRVGSRDSSWRVDANGEPLSTWIARGSPTSSNSLWNSSLTTFAPVLETKLGHST